MIVYVEDKKALAQFKEAATRDFWDSHWHTDDLRGYIRSYRADNLFIPEIKKFLPHGSRVLEGGCGRGQLVFALQGMGYQAVGIDFARRTIRRIHESVPELDVGVGDVRYLPIGDGQLDGYLSVGVIEHFWDGYDLILTEAHRVLKTGGYLFLSFPYLSPLRKLKLTLRSYSCVGSRQLENLKEKFYQFVLDKHAVVTYLDRLGLRVLKSVSYDGIKGLKDEICAFRRPMQMIYDNRLGPVPKHVLDRILRPFSPHCVLLVARKTR